jgi:hypothetical protein
MRVVFVPLPCWSTTPAAPPYLPVPPLTERIGTWDSSNEPSRPLEASVSGGKSLPVSIAPRTYS